MPKPLAHWLLGLTLLLFAACGYDRSDRWDPIPVVIRHECSLSDRRCHDDVLEECAGDDDPAWLALDDCSLSEHICSSTLLACARCEPGNGLCDGALVLRCNEAGSDYVPESICDQTGHACRDGSCQDLCALATIRRSNVGCEYWAADLDNANVGTGLNAAAQQFAVVVSNPQLDVAAEIAVERDDTLPRTTGAPVVMARATVPPNSLRVFRLGPREVDGSEPGTYNTGTHTALTRSGYRIRASVPIIAYQFNPLENLDVFSNDASLLKPVEALASQPGMLVDAYVVLGWPQTIASTDNPETNFSANNPTDLRAFLTILATRDGTRVTVRTSARILGDGADLPEVPVGGQLDVVLDAFDVLNLESDDFNADFTGTIVAASQAIVVFSGSEASDAPFFETLADRRCCADHLEEQLDPIRTSGNTFVATVSPSRTRAVAEAGATLGVVEQPEYFRLIATTAEGARVRTSLPDRPEILLPDRGDFADVTSVRDFLIESDAPIMLASISPSQDAAGIPRGFPGGDPSFLLVPPIEQFRSNYVFLTPDKYNFDFVRIIAPSDATIVLDNQRLDTIVDCRHTLVGSLATSADRAPVEWLVHTCQLSFPTIRTLVEGDIETDIGRQNDGVHRLESDRPVGVLVNGFDSYVSYAYAAGTELEHIIVE